MTSQLERLITNAIKAHAMGRLDPAEKFSHEALGIDPQNVQALMLAGIVAAKKGQATAALPYLEQVREKDPTSFQARLWLSMTYRKLGELRLALERGLEATQLNPRDPQGQNQVGLCYVDLHNFENAEGCFRQALEAAPSVAVVHYGLGLALQGQRRSVEAIASFRKAGELDAKNLTTQKNLRQILMDEFDPAGAAECSRRIVEIQPNSAEAHLLLARALVEDNKADEAETYIRKAIELEPEGSLAHTLLGSALQTKGKIEDADFHFRKSIELAPEQGSAYLALASNRKMTESDRDLLRQMEKILESVELPERHSSQLHYALGKAHEDLKEYEPALRHFDEANRLTNHFQFAGRSFDRQPLAESYDFCIRTFTKAFLDRYRSLGSSSDRPIFVVGMMRSGTTLAEQILSSHPKVGAGGELRFWSDHRNDAFAHNATAIDPAMLKWLQKQYLKITDDIAPDRERVVDKMPVNFEVLGLIHLAFPNAKIIHTRRNPVDTCISIYTTPNRTRLEWAHDRESIVFAYRQYLRLMDHWRSVLPEGSMLEVPYEEVVSDRERVTREMIAFCGLEWDDACLRPEDNERAVVTPSVWQVRQPVYTTSMERWRRYEPWLGPFSQLLASA